MLHVPHQENNKIFNSNKSFCALFKIAHELIFKCFDSYQLEYKNTQFYNIILQEYYILIFGLLILVH